MIQKREVITEVAWHVTLISTNLSPQENNNESHTFKALEHADQHFCVIKIKQTYHNGQPNVWPEEVI